MKENRVRTKLKKGEQVFGVLTPIFDPQVVEVIAHLGFECYMLDCEHGAGSPGDAEAFVRTCEGGQESRRWLGCEASTPS